MTRSSETDALTIGGEALKEWFKDALADRFLEVPVIAFGGSIVPQMGEKSGERLNLEPSKIGELQVEIDFEDLITKLAKLESEIYESVLFDSFFYDVTCLKDQNLRVYFSPISFKKSLIFGHIWAIIPDNNKFLERYVDDLSDLIGTLTSAEKLTQSMRILSLPVWKHSTATRSAASEATRAVREAVSCLSSIVWIANKENQMLERFASDGNVPNSFSMDLPFREGVVGYCNEHAKVLMIDDLTDVEYLNKKYGIAGVFHEKLVEEFGWKSGVFVPLDTGDDCIGVLSVYGPRARGFSESEREIVSVFAQRLTANYVHANNDQHLSRLEANLRKEAPAIRTGLLALRRVHDADNELSMAQNSLSSLARDNRHEPNSRNYRNAMSAAQHIDYSHKILKEMVSEAVRYDRLRLGNRNLKGYLKEICLRYENDVDARDIRINLTGPDNLIVRVDHREFARAISNILDNAIEFLKGDRKGGKKIIDIEFGQERSGFFVHIEDNGPGIEEGKSKEIFESFYTTRPKKGLGFGLWIAKDIVEQHKGSIKANSKWGAWTRFELSIPKL